MSLFPAYVETTGDTSSVTESGRWLENLSFVPEYVANIPIPDRAPIEQKEDAGTGLREPIASSSKERDRVRKKNKKDVKCYKEPRLEESELYYLDRTREPGYLLMKTLGKPIVPRYNRTSKGIIPYSVLKSKKSKKSRYYYGAMDEESENHEDNEVEIREKTEKCNQSLDRDPSNDSVWAEYVDLQDEIFECKFRYRQASNTDKSKLLAERKLSILDKALKHNVGNEELLKKWLHISQVYPVEEVNQLIEGHIKRSPHLSCLWLGLANVWMFSLSCCTVSKVVNIYERGLETLHKGRVHIGVSDSLKIETGMLELLIHCFMFLSHAGLWEKLWSVVKMYIIMSLGNKCCDLEPGTSQLNDLEDRLLESGLPLPAIWYRIERLRQTCYFLPVPANTDAADPQRIVVHDDIVNLVYHINPKLNFHLATVLLTVLKVPPLPFTDSVVRYLFLNKNTWTMDFVEFVFATVVDSPCFNTDYSHLKVLTSLVTGPQYIVPAPGQEQFLSLIFKTFQAIHSSLDKEEKTAIGLWMLRFERWLSYLDHLQLLKLPKNRKQSKQMFKEFLQQTENRENLLYYREYALYEHNSGNTKSAIKVLKSSISTCPPVKLSVANMSQHVPLITLYRTQCELLISEDKLDEAVLVLNKLFSNRSVEEIKLFTNRVVQQFDDRLVTGPELFLSNVVVELVSCTCWFVACTDRSSESACDNIDDVLLHFAGRTNSLSQFVIEGLYETKIAISWKFSKRLNLKDTVTSMLVTFAHNSLLVSAAAALEREQHSLWWLFMKRLTELKTSLSVISWSTLAMSRIDSSPAEHKSCFINRTCACLTKLCSQTQSFNTGSLLHRLRLKFNEKYLIGSQETTFMCCLGNYPWIKAVYVDGVNYIPTKLNELTDLLVEKEMRVHVTPDELDAMRD